MNEYINKEQIIKDLKNLLALQEEIGFFEASNTTRSIIEKIKNTPPANVKEITHACW